MEAQAETQAEAPAAARNGDAQTPEALPRRDESAGVWATDPSGRERIPGSALVPGCVSWSEDGRLAVVSDASVMIATFRSRELEMYLQESPAVSKSFIFQPESTLGEHLPVPIPVFREPTNGGLPPGSATHFLLNDANRHQHNPKELSLSKNDGKAFLSATWGPRGSGPNASCAMLTLSTSSRVGLHFASSFEMSWKEVGVFSEKLVSFFSAHNFMTAPTQDSSEHGAAATTTVSKPKKRQRTPGAAKAAKEDRNAMREYAHKCAMLSTLTTAWSPFMMAEDTRLLTSLIAFAGRKACTVWAYPLPAFETGAMAHGGNALLSPEPVAWVDTEQYGWVTTSSWQQMHVNRAAPTNSLELALGTSEGHVLLCAVPVSTGASVRDASGPFPPPALPPGRLVMAPHAQPVFQLCLGSLSTYSNSGTNDLIVGSGSTISVWNVKKKRPQLTRKWKAHDGNITSVAIDYFGSWIVSSSVDGVIKVWDKASGIQTMSNDGDGKDSSGAGESHGHGANNASKFPVFGLAISPSSAQVTCVYVIPPAARPNRKSQADISYSRVSSSLEFLPSPWMRRPEEEFVANICRILKERGSASSFTDVVWFCYRDNAALLALHESSEGVLPALLSKISTTRSDGNGAVVPAAGPDAGSFAKRPVYLAPAPLDPAVERLVTTIYSGLAPDETRSNWEAFVQETKRAMPSSSEQLPAMTPPVPPPRQKCFICQKPVPFSESKQQCESCHTQDRCFLSFRVMASMDSWKCMGCGALANEIDFSGGKVPFYLSCEPDAGVATALEGTASTNAPSMMCRLCGNYCSYFKY